MESVAIYTPAAYSGPATLKLWAEVEAKMPDIDGRGYLSWLKTQIKENMVHNVYAACEDLGGFVG